jgi:predicted alpha-1,2-mannosidase
MKKNTKPNPIFTQIILGVILLVSVSCSSSEDILRPIDYVDPFIGSGGHGHVFVGACVPFGAVQIGPNNINKGWDWCSGYHYSDSLIIGFSNLHLSGTGIGDRGDVLIMPFTGEVRLDKGKQEYPHDGYLSAFSHDNESAEPGYYSVEMDNGVKVELTASERVGFHRYYFPKNEEAHIVIDLKEGIRDKAVKASIRQIDEYTFMGERISTGWAKEHQVFFAIKSSVAISDMKYFENNAFVNEDDEDNKIVSALINFETTPERISLKVGISPISSENALANIEAEIPDWDFGRVVTSAQNKWNEELSKISVETENEANKRIFYSSLFHSFIHPSLYNDFNGDYMGADNKVHTNTDFTNYTVLSLWDTYRAAHPLFTITQSERVDDFINSMLAIFDEQGYLPIWHLDGFETHTMVGISSIQVIAEAYLKGYRGFDAERALAAIKATTMLDIEGMNYLREMKPIPSDTYKDKPVAHAMELCIGDGSAALMAKAMGNDEDYEYFSKRAKNYQQYWDESVRFFRGINSDGTWNQLFIPLSSSREVAKDYSEGNAWQYLWMAPQDVSGLIDLMGGEDRFVARLDSFFTIENESEDEIISDITGLIGQYAHGNEPSHHIAYLYAYAGQQWKTAEKVRFIMKEFYHDDPDGLIGNEDAGQMSAWYVFSSLGFYPVFPASTEYVFGSPLFEKASINLPEGKIFTVITENNSEENMYIQSIELNGADYNKRTINHQDIMNGGELKFVMGSTPNYDFGK